MDFELQHNQFHSNDGPFMFTSNNLDCTNENMNQTLSDSGNAITNNSHKYSGYQNGAVSYQNWYNTTRNFNAPSFGCHYIPPSNNTSCPIPLAGSSTNYLAMLESQAIGYPSTEYDIRHHLDKNVGKSYQRENTAAALESYSSASTTSEVSSSYGFQSSGELHEIHQSLHSLPSAIVPAGSLMRVRNGSFGPQPESAYQLFPIGAPPTYLHGQCFGPSRNGVTQVGQIGPSNGYSYWNFFPAFPYVPGRYLQSEYLGMTSNTLQGYKDPRLYAPLPYEDERQVQDIQVHNHYSGSQIPDVSYQPPMRYFQHRNGNPFLSEHNLVPRLSPGQFTGEQIHSSFSQPSYALSAVTPRNTRNLSVEASAAHEASRIYDLENTVDEHQQMRLEIDGMSYEELLALEEQIGDVHTGLTEECVAKNLLTRIHSHKLASSPSDEFCVVCQVEYNEGDSLGILCCGHKYHSSCITQWLLVKNLCPICKKSGLAMGGGKG